MPKTKPKDRTRNASNPPKTKEAQENWEKHNTKGKKIQKPKTI